MAGAADGVSDQRGRVASGQGDTLNTGNLRSFDFRFAFRELVYWEKNSSKMLLERLCWP